MSLNPARIYGLDAGVIAEGKNAEIVIYDPQEIWIPEKYESKSSNTPFTGWKLKGKVRGVIGDGSR